jgi:hypothetical protein
VTTSSESRLAQGQHALLAANCCLASFRGVSPLHCLTIGTLAAQQNSFILAIPKGGEGRCRELEHSILRTAYPCLRNKTVPVGRSIGQFASTRPPTRVAEPNAQARTTALGYGVVRQVISPHSGDPGPVCVLAQANACVAVVKYCTVASGN